MVGIAEKVSLVRETRLRWYCREGKGNKVEMV
jgi:hypothetical protein